MKHKQRIEKIEQRLNMKELKTTYTETADGFKLEFERDKPNMVTELRIHGISGV